MNSGVSIIICFYNAGQKIVPTLNHIIQQIGRNPNSTELILVNNNSSDNTLALVKNILNQTLPFTWKIVEEPNPGLANARLCGLAHAQYDILLYCDDDNWLSPHFVTQGETFLRSNPDVAILGGKGIAVSSIPIPDWFDAYQNYYAVGPQLESSGRVRGNRNMVYGAGMFIRKSTFDYLLNCGFKFQSLGRTGKNLSAGEDSELCLAVQITGQQIWYLEDLTFQHYMEPFRLEVSYLKKLQKGMNYSGFYGRFYRDYLFGYIPQITTFFWMKEILYTFLETAKSISKLDFKIKRNFILIGFILKERNNYNERIKKIILICNNLKNPTVN